MNPSFHKCMPRVRKINPNHHHYPLTIIVLKPRVRKIDPNHVLERKQYFLITKTVLIIGLALKIMVVDDPKIIHSPKQIYILTNTIMGFVLSELSERVGLI